MAVLKKKNLTLIVDSLVQKTRTIEVARRESRIAKKEGKQLDYVEEDLRDDIRMRGTGQIISRYMAKRLPWLLKTGLFRK